MYIRYRLTDPNAREVDAIFFKGDHDFSRGEEQGVRYTIERANLDDLDNVDREKVAFLILKSWYRHVIATSDLDGYLRAEGKKQYEAAVRSMGDDVVSYAKTLLLENKRLDDSDHEAITVHFDEQIDVAFNRLEPLDVLRHTDNENALNMHGMPLSKERPVQDLAYWAFYDDVMDEVREQIDLEKPDLGLDEQHAVDGD